MQVSSPIHETAARQLRFCVPRSLCSAESTKEGSIVFQLGFGGCLRGTPLALACFVSASQRAAMDLLWSAVSGVQSVPTPEGGSRQAISVLFVFVALEVC